MERRRSDDGDGKAWGDYHVLSLAWNIGREVKGGDWHGKNSRRQGLVPRVECAMHLFATSPRPS